MNAPNPHAYLRTKVLTANPAELRLLLLDGAIRFAQQARQGLAERNYEQCYTGASRCQNILLELINGLRPEHSPDLCEKVAALYTYMYTQMVKATTERSAETVAEVIRLLEYERETWSLLMGQLSEKDGGKARTGVGAAGKAAVGGSVSLRG